MPESKKSELEIFCYRQVVGRVEAEGHQVVFDKSSGAELICTSHSWEGKAFVCSYNQSEIYEDNGKLKITHRDSKGNLTEVCKDFARA